MSAGPVKAMRLAEALRVLQARTATMPRRVPEYLAPERRLRASPSAWGQDLILEAIA